MGDPNTLTAKGEQANTLTFSKDTVYGAVIAVLACLLVISVFTQGFGLVKIAVPAGNTTQPSANPSVAAQGAANPQPTGQQPANPAASGVKTLELPQSLNLAPVMGPANSKISLLEFSDFQCPYCGMAFGSTWTQSPQYAGQTIPSITGAIQKFEADYVTTGKADFIHIPVAFLGLQNGVNESVDSADAALCAKDQGKYFEMYDAIFNAQTPSEGDGKYSKANLKTIAQGVSGLDQAKFDACLDNNTYVNLAAEYTNEWMQSSQANTGSAGTPTMWILVDASKTTQAQVSAAATAAGFTWGITSDKSTYVILLASPEYAKLQQVMAALA